MSSRSPFGRLVDRLVALAREKDPPKKVALGMSLGIFIGLLPIMGVQMAVVTLMAVPLRGNLKAAIAGVWVSNPITFIPMYWGYYRFGLLFTPSREIGWSQFETLIRDAAQWDWNNISGSVYRAFGLGADILIPMWIGSFILAVAFSIPTYVLTFKLVSRFRAAHY